MTFPCAFAYSSVFCYLCNVRNDLSLCFSNRYSVYSSVFCYLCKFRNDISLCFSNRYSVFVSILLPMTFPCALVIVTAYSSVFCYLCKVRNDLSLCFSNRYSVFVSFPLRRITALLRQQNKGQKYGYKQHCVYGRPR